MPIFEFECQKCKKKTEVIQSYSQSAPTCCGAEMKRLISRGVGAKFKGSGFHVNDYPARR